MIAYLRSKKYFKTIVMVLLLGASLYAAAALFGFDSTSWKEEVLLHDGSKIVVERSVSLGGRHEIGQEPPIREQSLRFKLPGTTHTVVWEDTFSADIGTANFLPMLMEIDKGVIYLLAYPMGCPSYNKWGRPNPPYVVFKHDGTTWNRVELEKLPSEIRNPNLIFSSPEIEARKAGGAVTSAETIAAIYAGYKQPEFRKILREPLSKERITEMCGDRVLYKGHWIVPNSPTARAIVDADQK